MNITRTILLCSFISASLASANLHAQSEKAKGSAPSVPGSPRSVRAPDRTEFLAKQLGLTEEQKPKVKTVLDEETKQFSELRTNRVLSAQDRQTKFREIRANTAEKLKPILNEEQWQKYQKNSGMGRSGIRTNALPSRVTK